MNRRPNSPTSFPGLLLLGSVHTITGYLFVPTRKCIRYSVNNNGTELEQIFQTYRTSHLSGWPRGSSKIQSSLLNIYFRLCGFHASPRSYYSLPLRSEYPAAFTLQQSVAQNLYDMWRSTFEISEAQLPSLPYKNRTENYRSYVWIKALSGTVFTPAQKLSGNEWT